MNLLDTILKNSGGNVTEQLAKSFGLDQQQAGSALQSLVPVLSRSVQKNISSGNGLQELIGALTGGSHQRYLDDPSTIESKESVDDGNAILGHLLGSKDVSRNAAAAAAQQTGLDVGVLKKMLPAIAGIAMGALSKKASGDGLLNTALEQGGLSGESGVSSMLSSFLDADKDGSVLDDVLDITKRFF